MSATASDFSKKTFETFLLRTLTQVFGLAMSIAIGRALGPSGKGLFTYAMTVLALLATLSGGASAAVSRQYGRLKRPSGVVYDGMMRVFWCICVPFAVTLAAVAASTHQIALLAAAIAFPFAYITQATLAFSLSDGQVRWSNVQGLIVTASTAVLTGGVSFAMHSALWSLASWLLVMVVISIVSLRKIAPYKVRRDEKTDSGEVFRHQVFFGFRITFNQLLAMLNYQIDIFIILALMGHAALGVYSVAVGLGQLMWHVSRPLAVTSYGRITSGTPEEAARITMSCVRHALLMVGTACVVLFFAGPWLIVAVYGAAFAKAGLALQILLPGILAYCTVPFFSQYFSLQMGRTGLNTLVIGTSTVVCAVCTVLLVPRFGILAGAIGTSASYIGSLCLCAYIFSRNAGVPISDIVSYGRDDLRQYSALAQWIFSHARVRS
jgi:O-antigen/teichoic acid export membrane protein